VFEFVITAGIGITLFPAPSAPVGTSVPKEETVVTFIESLVVVLAVETPLLVFTAPASPSFKRYDSYPPTEAPPSNPATEAERVYQTSPPDVTLASQAKVA
jgi:hypothetical protein